MILVNSVEKELTGEIALEEFLMQEGFTLTKLAVVLNGDIVPKIDYKNVRLNDGDMIEIVSFVGGG